MPVPYVRVEAGFASAPDDPVQAWTDISAYVRLADGISMTRGRSDEFDQVQPGRLSLTLDNSDGRFTYGYASGAYYPNVKPRKRIRVSVSTDGMSWRPRFDGYVDGWPAEWAGGITQQARVRITATDRLVRFGRIRALRDPLLEELGTAAEDQGAGWVLDSTDWSVLDSTTTLAGGVVWLYGLQESSGSVVAGDVSGATGRPLLTISQTGADGTAEFGTAGIMPEGTAVAFTPASTNNGKQLAASPTMYVGTEFSVWCQFAWSGTAGVQLLRLGPASGNRITITATSSTVVATVIGDTTAAVTKTITTNDNRPHWLLLTVSAATASLYVDDEAVATAAMPTGLGTVQGLTVGGVSSGDPHQLAWVGFANSATTAERAVELAMLGTGGSERSDERVARFLRWLGLTSDADLEVGLSDVAYQATGGGQALDLIGAVNEVEGGAFFPTGDGRLTFHSRDHRYNRPVSATFTAEQVAPDLEVQVDAAQLVNDYSVSRPAGATVRVRDAASVADYEEHPLSATLYAASDDDLRNAAEWRVGRYAQPSPRIPGIGVDLLTATGDVALSALGVEIGDRIEVTGLPSTTTPGGADVVLFAEGVEESVSHTSWLLRIATSPDWGGVWTLDDATWSLLDTSTRLAY